VARGIPSSARALAGAGGQEDDKDRVQGPVGREPKAWSSPRAPSEGDGHARARPYSLA